MSLNIHTTLLLSDNSGLKKLKNINILNIDKKLKINNTAIAIVKKGINKKLNIKKSDIVNALIVCTKCYNFFHTTGTKFSNISTVLMKNDSILCTKIKGLIASVVKPKLYKSKVNIKKAKFI